MKISLKLKNVGYAVPRRTLSNGARIPVVGMGTFGSDKYSPETVAAAVVEAAKLGYRHFDCASVYGNEPQVGASLQQVMAAGVRREDLWITSKVWNDMHGEGEVIASCKQSLQDLGLDYLDLYLVHWPFPNFHPKGCSVDFHNPNAKPYIHDAYMRTWAQMEELHRMGLVRTIGTSNMTIPKMRLLLRDCSVKPAVNEMEIHPHFQQAELYDYMVDNAIQPIGFCPIGSPSRPARDRTPQDTSEMEEPVILKIAARLGVHPAVVCIMWAVKRGGVTIPFAVKPDQLASNLKAAVEIPLTPEDMRAIAGIDKGCRLVKGQVFVWREELSWEALWDLDGVIRQ
ncbi:MAG: aldo/keto reductase [Kiritimatiellae bacterium]|nr:aldo/keto reductase [Kiritimatiellia bacterium]